MGSPSRRMRSAYLPWRVRGGVEGGDESMRSEAGGEGGGERVRNATGREVGAGGTRGWMACAGEPVNSTAKRPPNKGAGAIHFGTGEDGCKQTHPSWGSLSKAAHATAHQGSRRPLLMPRKASALARLLPFLLPLPGERCRAHLLWAHEREQVGPVPTVNARGRGLRVGGGRRGRPVGCGDVGLLHAVDQCNLGEGNRARRRGQGVCGKR